MPNAPMARRRKRRGSKQNDEPFTCLVFKVGLSILGICWICTHVYLYFSTNINNDGANGIPHRSSIEEKKYGVKTKFPVFQLDPGILESDAYGISQILARCRFASSNHSTSHMNGNLSQFYNEASQMRKQFASLYGGEDAARYLIHSGITSFQSSEMDENQIGLSELFGLKISSNIPSGLKHTATRILEAKHNNRPFKIAFAGYSVTVGRGNYFHQSYPIAMERFLTKAMSLLGIELQVRNAAIGGVPSFPYGWCLNSFLGDDADVISWDFSMNEPGGVADGLEAYMRHGLSMDRRPMLIVKDASVSIAAERRKLVQKYVDLGAMKDPIMLGIDDAMEKFLSLKEDVLPIGFREWRKFGAPMGAPGQSPHHPGVKEHELLGWLLAMHFLAALELVAFVELNAEKEDVHKNYLIKEHYRLDHSSLPAPVHGENVAPSNLLSLFYGTQDASKSADSMSWKMNPVHCRTTYDPILNNSLQNIVVDGSLGEELNVMLPKGAQLFNKGWVFDLGKNEKNAKKKLERFGGLGYIDSKKAYYGIYASGPLELFLPCLDRNDLHLKMQASSEEQQIRADECFKNLVICEVNEKHTSQECDLHRDLSFRVGGIIAEDAQSVNATGTSYWGRNICLRVPIPDKTVLSKRHDPSNNAPQIGISFEISVASTSVIIHTGPCSVSHVIWEQEEKIMEL